MRCDRSARPRLQLIRRFYGWSVETCHMVKCRFTICTPDGSTEILSPNMDVPIADALKQAP